MSALAMVTQEPEFPMIDLGNEVGLMAEASLTMCHCIRNMSASASRCSRKGREHTAASSVAPDRNES
jgi:hypothetical protein